MRIDNPSFVGDEAAITGSFTGSFFGDGSGLTNVTATLDTGSFITTASINSNTLTFTKGNADTFNLTVDTGSGVSSYTQLTDIPQDIVSSSIQLAGDISGSIILTSASLASSIILTSASLASSITDILVGNVLVSSASYAISASHETTFELSSSHADVADSVPYSGITGVPANIVSSSVLSSPSQGNAILTTNGVAGTTVDLGLQTSDHVQFHCIGVGTAPSIVLGEIRAAGDITAFYSSDERLKTNITPIDSALDKLEQIKGYTFDWLPKEGVHSHEGNDIGVIAQEVEKIIPNVVTTRDSGYKAVQYEKLVPLLIQAVNELQLKVKELENASR